MLTLDIFIIHAHNLHGFNSGLEFCYLIYAWDLNLPLG